MNNSLDKITATYIDEFGTLIGEKVRQRIHWICENAKGEKILDVGCNKGITAIILGRECKQVLGIDLLQESIDYAEELLEQENEAARKYTRFELGNFIEKEFISERFDCVILGDSLTHICDTDRLIKKAISLIKDGGRLIITVPFGINDYSNYKTTYYLAELLKLAENNYIEKIAFFGKWVGMIITKKESLDVNFNKVKLTLLEELERNFYLIEKDHIFNSDRRERTIESMQKQIQDLKQVIDTINMDNSVQTKTLEDKEQELCEIKQNKITELDQILDKLKYENAIMAEKLSAKENLLKKTQKENNLLKDKVEKITKQAKKNSTSSNELKKQLQTVWGKVIQLREQKIDVQKKLYDSYDKEVKHLNSYKTLHNNYEKLQHKYNAICNSKLGSLIISYWKWKMKLKKGR